MGSPEQWCAPLSTVRVNKIIPILIDYNNFSAVSFYPLQTYMYIRLLQTERPSSQLYNRV